MFEITLSCYYREYNNQSKFQFIMQDFKQTLKRTFTFHCLELVLQGFQFKYIFYWKINKEYNLFKEQKVIQLSKLLSLKEAHSTNKTKQKYRVNLCIYSTS